MFSRPVPPSAPASQKHTFGQEIAGKRARKDGLAGGHYGFFRLFGLVTLRWDAIRHFLLTLAVIGHKGCERFALSFTGTGLSMRF